MASDAILSIGLSWSIVFMIPLTHYGGGAAPILYGAGFVTQGKWWQLGFIMVTVNLVIRLGIGSLWWKVIGLW